jgi:hypothetical protein
MLKQISKTLIVASILIAPLSIQADEAQDKGIKSAYVLFETINMKDTYKKIIDNVFDMQVRQNPKLKAIEPEMKAFLEKYMGWSAIKDDMAKIYAKHYTADEIKELNAFYKTPVGKKTARLMPKLSKEGAQLGQSKINAHMDELQAIIIKAMRSKK